MPLQQNPLANMDRNIRANFMPLFRHCHVTVCGVLKIFAHNSRDLRFDITAKRSTHIELLAVNC